MAAATGIAVHLAALDWQAIADELTAHGYAIVPGRLRLRAGARHTLGIIFHDAT